MPFSATGKPARHSQRHGKSRRLIAYTEYSICLGAQPHVYFGNHESLCRDALRFSIPFPPITRLRFRPRTCQPTARDTMLLFLMNRTRSKFEIVPFRVMDDGHSRGSRFRSKRTFVRLLRIDSLLPLFGSFWNARDTAPCERLWRRICIRYQGTKGEAFRFEPQVDRRNDERSKRCWRSSKVRWNTVGALSSSLLSRGLSPYAANVVLALKKQQGRSGLI